MNVEFYFDPVCPWTWITSRWVEEVRVQRKFDVKWQSYSLFAANGGEMPADEGPEAEASVRALRLVEAVRAEFGDERIGELYTRLGTAFHHDDDKDFSTLESIVVEMGLPPELVAAADDPTWDEAIEASMDQAEEAAGGEVGIPLLVVAGDGPRRAFFGPVFSPAPTGLAALAAWDGMAAMLAVPGFFELKRHRDHGPELPPRPHLEHDGVIDLARTEDQVEPAISRSRVSSG